MPEQMDKSNINIQIREYICNTSSYMNKSNFPMHKEHARAFTSQLYLSNFHLGYIKQTRNLTKNSVQTKYIYLQSFHRENRWPHCEDSPFPASIVCFVSQVCQVCQADKQRLARTKVNFRHFARTHLTSGDKANATHTHTGTCIVHAHHTKK